jgi:carbonic anhydrase
MSNWSYQNYGKWGKMYNQCSIKNNPKQSPIDIIPDKIVQECQAKCEVILKYKASKCYIRNDHNAITINYDPGSYLIYQNNWYQLTKAKIHTPSMHTMNGQTYGAEIDLYHCSDNQCNDGVVLAILLNRGADHGESVDFFNQFINQVPLVDTPVEREVEVSDNWNIISLIPDDRTAYSYEGSLPHPPCTPGWKWFVFNQPTTIGQTALKTLQYNVVNTAGSTNRPAMNPKNTDIFRVPHNAFKIFEERVKPSPTPTVDPSISKELLKQEGSVNLTGSQANILTKYWMDYRKIIYRTLLICFYALTIYLAIRITKYLIKNDLVNKVLTGEGNLTPMTIENTQPMPQQTSTSTST